MDYMFTSVSKRFEPETVNAYKGLTIIPYNLITYLKEPQGRYLWKSQFKTFGNFYKKDFPNFTALEGALGLWEQYWKTFTGIIPENISLTLKEVSFPGFENIKFALRILGTLPVTSCECEKSFSAMRRLKEYTRSTMTEDRLNGLALMYIHQNIVPNIEKVINRFAISNRRLDFS